MVEIFDIDKIKNKVKQITEQVAKQEIERQEIRNKIRELTEQERNYKNKISQDVSKEFADLEQQFTFITDVRQKFDALAKSYSKAIKTQDTVIQLYGKAFKRLSNDRVTIPKDVFDMTADYGEHYTLTLYSKGLGLPMVMVHLNSLTIG